MPWNVAHRVQNAGIFDAAAHLLIDHSQAGTQRPIVFPREPAPFFVPGHNTEDTAINMPRNTEVNRTVERLISQN
jgi:hypothetical protein